MTTSLPVPPVAEHSVPPSSRPWLYVMTHTDPSYGGLSSAVPALGETISSEQGFQISLAAFCNAHEHYRPAGYEGEKIRFWPASRKPWLTTSSLHTSLRNLIAQAQGLHIHGLWEQSTLEASLLSISKDKPYVLSAHGMLEPWALGNKRLKKLIYAALVEKKVVANAACLHALTVEEARQYRRFGARGPIAVIPNAVSVPQQLDSALFFEQFPELRARRLVLFMARLHPKKGADVLVEAWAKMAKKHPEAVLVLAGPDGDGMGAKLREQIHSAGLGDQVSIPGMLRSSLKWSAMAAAECFVLPSHSEGLSMAVLEAMGAGLPVIVTPGCNMPEVTANEAGWEVELSADFLAERLNVVLQRSPAENRRTGARGAELIAANYSPRRVAEQMAAVYEYVSGGALPMNVELHLGEVR